MFFVPVPVAIPDLDKGTIYRVTHPKDLWFLKKKTTAKKQLNDSRLENFPIPAGQDVQFLRGFPFPGNMSVLWGRGGVWKSTGRQDGQGLFVRGWNLRRLLNMLNASHSWKVNCSTKIASVISVLWISSASRWGLCWCHGACLMEMPRCRMLLCSIHLWIEALHHVVIPSSYY